MLWEVRRESEGGGAGVRGGEKRGHRSAEAESDRDRARGPAQGAPASQESEEKVGVLQRQYVRE